VKSNQKKIKKTTEEKPKAQDVSLSNLVRPLVLHLKRKYWEDILAGKKLEEYRLWSSYWDSRLVGKTFSFIELHCGYPKKDDADWIIRRRWNGYVEKIIRHEQFGDKQARVFAIDVSQAA
jgi:hypothetical protein